MIETSIDVIGESTSTSQEAFVVENDSAEGVSLILGLSGEGAVDFEFSSPLSDELVNALVAGMGLPEACDQLLVHAKTLIEQSGKTALVSPSSLAVCRLDADHFELCVSESFSAFVFHEGELTELKTAADSFSGWLESSLPASRLIGELHDGETLLILSASLVKNLGVSSLATLLSSSKSPSELGQFMKTLCAEESLQEMGGYYAVRSRAAVDCMGYDSFGKSTYRRGVDSEAYDRNQHFRFYLVMMVLAVVVGAIVFL